MNRPTVDVRDRYKKIIKLRYQTPFPHTLTDVARAVGVSRQRIYTLEQQALAALGRVYLLKGGYQEADFDDVVEHGAQHPDQPPHDHGEGEQTKL